ncbi:MAG: helix-turn-helix domain-containing protein [Actinobacteria bacterium]|nr:helix-turn-helix domain-containing protein [Actinomycetota bacterium]
MYSQSKPWGGLPRDAYVENLRLCSVRTFAEKYSLPMRWMYTSARSQGVPVIKVGKYLRVRLSSVESWAEGKRVPEGRTTSLPDKTILEQLAGEDVSYIRGSMLRMREVAELLDLPCSWFYTSAAKHGFPMFKIGKYCMVSVGGLEDWLRQREEQAEGLAR